MYVGCLILLCGKLQTENMFSTTEAECIAFIQAIFYVLPFMALLR